MLQQSITVSMMCGSIYDLSRSLHHQIYICPRTLVYFYNLRSTFLHCSVFQTQLLLSLCVLRHLLSKNYDILNSGILLLCVLLVIHPMLICAIHLYCMCASSAINKPFIPVKTPNLRKKLKF